MSRHQCINPEGSGVNGQKSSFSELALYGKQQSTWIPIQLGLRFKSRSRPIFGRDFFQNSFVSIVYLQEIIFEIPAPAKFPECPNPGPAKTESSRLWQKPNRDRLFMVKNLVKNKFNTILRISHFQLNLLCAAF